MMLRFFSGFISNPSRHIVAISPVLSLHLLSVNSQQPRPAPTAKHLLVAVVRLWQESALPAACCRDRLLLLLFIRLVFPGLLIV